MAVTSSLHFNFDGRNSSEFGIINVNMNSSSSLPFSENFLSNRSIQETQIRNNDRPYFASLQRNPLTFNLTFAFQNPSDDSNIRAVARWLDVDFYKPFYTLDNPDRIFYCMPTGDISHSHTGSNDGYITVQMRCDSPYSYSPTYTKSYDYSTNTTNGTLLQFTNNGDVELYPELWITKVGVGDMSIVNNSNGGKTFTFTGLADGEVVYIDNENEYIESSLEPSQYRYDSFNNTYLELVYGANNLMVFGNGKLQFRYQFKTLQGASDVV